MLAIFLVSALVVAVPLALVALAARMERGSAERLRSRDRVPAVAEELP